MQKLLLYYIFQKFRCFPAVFMLNLRQDISIKKQSSETQKVTLFCQSIFKSWPSFKPLKDLIQAKSPTRAQFAQSRILTGICTY